MTYIINTLEGIVQGQYGSTIPISVVDENGDAADLSNFTVVVLRALSPDAQTTVQLSGSFVSSSGGTLTVTPDSTTNFDVEGKWEGQCQFSDTGVLDLTEIFTIEVSKQI